MSTALVILSSLLSAAHFARFGVFGAAAACLSVALLPFARRPWMLFVLRAALFGFFFAACRTAVELVRLRVEIGAPWIRLAAILIVVCAVHATAFFVHFRQPVVARYIEEANRGAPSAAAFLLSALLLAIVQLEAPPGMLLLERFIPGGGWLEAFALALYAGFVVEKMTDAAAQPTWRRRIWLVFTIVFFVQLGLGLIGFDRFLMTGALHPPVPAVIAAGPLYRGGGFFMLILFATTVALVGPAWCSHLCYFGALDNWMADGKRSPRALPKWTPYARVSIVAVVMLTALLLRLFGVAAFGAALTALGFGMSGILLSVFISRRLGVMTHCAVFCPIGLFSNLFGKINPFRVRIDSGCTDCGRCTVACRYGALNTENIAARRPGFTCTLCGDCIGKCRGDMIEMRFAGLKGPGVRSAFLVLVTALHVLFLGTARI